MKRAIIVILFGMAGLSEAFAQSPTGSTETIEARKKAGFAQTQQRGLKAVSECLTMETLIDNADSATLLRVVGTSAFDESKERSQSAFWRNFLQDLGLSDAQISPAQSSASAMLRQVNGASPELREMLLRQLSEGVSSCRQKVMELRENQCSKEIVRTAPVTFFIPTSFLTQAKICREMAAMDAGATPIAEIRIDPERLAAFETQQEVPKAELHWFDTILLNQPVSQCARIGDMSIKPRAGYANTSAAYEVEQRRVEQAYETWATRPDAGNLSSQAMMAASQMDYVKWQGLCGDFKMVAGFDQGG